MARLRWEGKTEGDREKETERERDSRENVTNFGLGRVDGYKCMGIILAGPAQTKQQNSATWHCGIGKPTRDERGCDS